MKRFGHDGPYELSSPVLVICEGPSDVKFIERLFSARDITGFDVLHPGMMASGRPGATHRAPGKDGFGEVLYSLGAARGSERLESILLVTDCDDDPVAAFVSAANAFLYRGKSSARNPGRLDDGRSYERPSKPGEWSIGAPRTGVVLVPGETREGAIESLILDSLRSDESHRDKEDCFNAFLDCAVDVPFSTSNRDKLALTCTVAARDMKKPTATLLTQLERKPPLIDFGHPAFDDLVAVFRRLLMPSPAGSETPASAE